MSYLRYVIAVAMAGAALSVHAADPGCDRKIASIERQIQYAQQYNNQQRVRGLKTALARVQARCTDSGLIRDTQDDIDDKKDDVAALQESIQDSAGNGKTDKVKNLKAS